MAHAASLERGYSALTLSLKLRFLSKLFLCCSMWISSVFSEVSMPLLGTNTTPTVPLCPAQVLRTSINTRYKFWQQNQDLDYVFPYCLEVLQFFLFFQ